jgi:hypothetical protein
MISCHQLPLYIYIYIYIYYLFFLHLVFWVIDEYGWQKERDTNLGIFLTYTYYI